MRTPAQLLLRLFGVKPDPAPPAAYWRCPTCGHEVPVGRLVLGRYVPHDVALIKDYLDTAAFVRMSEAIRMSEANLREPGTLLTELTCELPVDGPA
jgi:hypothetical protein